VGLYLTQLAADSFNRANIYPLAAPWAQDTADSPGLQIVSDFCEPVTGGQPCLQLYGYSGGTPNDQFASFTTVSNLSSAVAYVGIRITDNGSSAYSLPGYYLLVVAGSWFLKSGGYSGTILLSGSTTINAGDTFTLAAVGTTLYVVQNSTQLGSITDSTYTSGTTLLGFNEGIVQVSNFAMGSATNVSTYSISGNCGAAAATVSYSGTASGSVTADGSGNYTISGLAAGSYTLTPSLSGYTFSPASQNETVSSANITGVNFTATSGTPYAAPGSFPFIGSVTIDNNAPVAGEQFNGTYEIVSAPPAGVNPVYQGSVKIRNSNTGYTNTSPHTGTGFPHLGSVVVLASPPVGVTKPWPKNGLVDSQ
jgi:hypothetical protein